MSLGLKGHRSLFTGRLAVAVSFVGALALLLWLWLQPDAPEHTTATPRLVPSSSDGPAPSLLVTPPLPTASVELDPGPLTSRELRDDSAPPEREYLEDLRALNHTDKQAALTLTEKGEQWYASTGVYAEARRAMRITLLVDLNRMAEARKLTREFIAQYPKSEYRRLVQGVTGIHPRPSGPRDLRWGPRL